MSKIKIDIADLKDHIGREVGLSGWQVISQSRVNKFAEATGDFQWIHVDAERARTDLASARTIIHNFLLLSLIPQAFDQVIEIGGLRYGKNRGARNIHFLRPLSTGSAVRIRLRLEKLDDREAGGVIATFHILMEAREDPPRPVMHTDILLQLVPA